VGGGDFNQMPETMFQMNEIVAIPGDATNYKFE
jgi:hypothetical protein